MKNHTIWESANRPLFIKSVWIENDGGHRHFILDYENERRLRDFNLQPRKGTLRSSSYEKLERKPFNLQLVGSAKVCKQSLPAQKVVKSSNSSPQKTFLDILKQRGAVIREESPSKRSSLQDLNTEPLNTDNCHDKLAERVLNWLDLAGKTTIFRGNTNLIESETLPISGLQSQSASTSRNRSSSSCRKTKINSVTKRPDSVKHITIIFNKEGIPVRYNRPIRFSDLFRSGYNATRKFVNNLTLARYTKLSDSVDLNDIREPSANQTTGPGTSAFDKASMDLKKSKGRTTTNNVKRHFESVYRPIIHKQILDESINMNEMKKQLHIFMPNLPKKVQTVPQLTTSQQQQTDCESTCLSTVLSDECQGTEK